MNYLTRLTEDDTESNTVFTVVEAFLLQPENSAVISLSDQDVTAPAAPFISIPVTESDAGKCIPKPLPVTVSTPVRLLHCAESIVAPGVTDRLSGLLPFGPLAAVIV
jgi:hypothetical protein